MSAIPSPPAAPASADPDSALPLVGLDPATVDAILRFRRSPGRETLRQMLPGLVAFHLPRGAVPPPDSLSDEMRLAEDLGLDSLALSEMTFKLEEIIGFSAETREVFEIRTVGALLDFLGRKLALS